MQPTSLELLVTGLALLIIVGGIMTAVAIVRRCRAGLTLVAYEPRRRVPWTAIDLFVILLTYLLAHFLFIRGMLALDGGGAEDAVANLDGLADSPQKMAIVLIANSIANVLTAMLAIALVHWRCGASADDLGLTARRLGSDIAHGAAAFSIVLVPIYLLQALLARFFTNQHPIIDLLQQSPQILLLVVAGLAAVIVAPVVEELLFRVLLQGWLETIWGVANAQDVELLAEAAHESPPPASDVVVVAPATDPNSYVPPAGPAKPTVAAFPANRPVLWPPVLISSLVFALMHLGNGPDPIPLFFLAVVLGYLYQRTHRMWAAVTLHFCLNGTSLLLLWTDVSRLGIEAAGK